MIEVEIHKMTPSVFNDFHGGYKVLQYDTLNGNRAVFGSRSFDELEEAEAYKKYIEEREAQRG